MSKGKVQEVLLMVGGILLLWLVLDNMNKNNKIQYLENKLDEANELSEEIKAKLQQLIENNADIDEEIKAELVNIAALIEIKQESKAVFTLAKIIENLLKKLYRTNDELRERVKAKQRKSATFEDYLEFAKDKNVVSKEDYHLISALKIMRNKEAHELTIIKEKGRLVGCILAGLSITLTLHRLVAKLKQEIS
ncbi:MAG: hypothetical protein EOO15_00405 [Chitinophagaceae bacterium]|nr:MAG: hypothetical protein EOO15_00405 [Chitinophagaceae bacterium]